MTIFTVPNYSGGVGPPGPPGPPGAAGAASYLTYGSAQPVPGSGILYLQADGGVITSTTGCVVPADSTLIGISIAVNTLPVNSYNVEILSDPSGVGGTGPTVLATLPLVGVLRNRTRALAIPITGLLDIGARLVRTAGAGPSVFNRTVVIAEVTTP